MGKIFWIAAAILATTSISRADDKKPQPPTTAPYSWTGFHAGLSVGARWSDTTWTTDSAGIIPINNAALPVRSFDSTSARLGGYAGYDWQLSPIWLVGIEGDVGWGNGSDRQTGIPGTVAPSFSPDSASVAENWDGSIRGRVGALIAPNWLLYVTGGLAFQQLEINANCKGLGNSWCIAPANQTASVTRTGWTFGIGTEWMVWKNWLARVEYRYADYGSVTQEFAMDRPLDRFTMTETLKMHTMLGGIGYRF